MQRLYYLKVKIGRTTVTSIIIKIVVFLALAGGVVGGINMYLTSLEKAAEKEAFMKLKLSEETNTRIALEESLKKQLESNAGLVVAQQAAQEEVNRYLEIFKKHELTRLARAKPGLIELRVNSGTEEVFSSIERVTKDE